ncbi:MAG: mannan-binding lectin [Desulfobacterales bacterium]|nr:mannan-binding lectin [Desulfobacterales bacterium]MBF0397949.1 mannan-binding lectin [Desulfobacterales bacterium]
MNLKSNLKAGFRANVRDVEAGPIWNDGDAAAKCPRVCKSQGGAPDGNWITTIPGKMSVCRCFF